MARQRAVTSPMGGRRRKGRLTDEQQAGIAQQQAREQRAHQRRLAGEREKTARQRTRAQVGLGVAGRPGADPAAAIKMVTGEAPGVADAAPRLSTRQRYLQTQLGIPVGTPGEGAARRKTYKATQAGLKASNLEFERTRTQPYMERLQKLYEPYKKSPQGDIYHKGEMTMPRRSKLTGIRGMQYLQRPAVEQQYAADQARAGLAGGGQSTRAAPAAAQPRAAGIEVLDQLNQRLQATTDPAEAADLIRQFDQGVTQLEQGMTVGAPAPQPQAAAPGPYSPGFQAFRVPGYDPSEIPPLGYEPSRAEASDFRPLPGAPTEAQVRGAPMVAPPPGQEELAAREAARPLYTRPPAAGPAGAIGGSPFGGQTTAERATAGLTQAQTARVTEATAGERQTRETAARDVATAKWSAIDTAALTDPNVPYGVDSVSRSDYEGARRLHDDFQSRSQGPADAVAFLDLHGAKLRQAITVGRAAMGDVDIRQAYVGWLEKLLSDLEALAAQARAPATTGPQAPLGGGRTVPPQRPGTR